MASCSIKNCMQLFNFHFKRTKVIALLTGLLALFLVINYYTQLNIIALEFAAGCTNKNMIRPTRPLAVLFGDSITQQGFIPENHGWTGRLANYWTRKVDVINRGYSGYNTVLGLNILEEMVLPLNPAFITIFFGANDASIKESKQHVPLADFEDNVRQMILLTKKHNPDCTIVLITNPPIHEPKLKESNELKGKPILVDRTNELAGQYANVVVNLGRTHNLPVVDIFDGMGGNDGDHMVRSAFLSDGLHLNQLGNTKLFESLISLFEKHEYLRWKADQMEMDKLPWADALENLDLNKKR